MAEFVSDRLRKPIICVPAPGARGGVARFVKLAVRPLRCPSNNRSLPYRKVLVQNLEQPLEVEGLGQIVHRPAGAQGFDLLRSGVRAEDYHGNRVCSRIGFESLEHLIAHQIGEVQIEQDEIRMVHAGKLKADKPLHRRNQPNILPLGENHLKQAHIG